MIEALDTASTTVTNQPLSYATPPYMPCYTSDAERTPFHLSPQPHGPMGLAPTGPAKRGIWRCRTSVLVYVHCI